MTVAELDAQAERVVRDHYSLVMNEDDPARILSDDDGLSAAFKAEAIYRKHTNWSQRKILDRACDIAFSVMTQLRNIANSTTI